MSDRPQGFLEGQFSSRDAPGQPPTPAGTVVPLRDGQDGVELLLLRRGRTSAFGGMWVFPGGKVDPADREHPLARPDDPEDRANEVAAARSAAVREGAEEAQLPLDPGAVVVHSFWLPPPEAPRRFATWFFLAPVTAGQAVVVDRSEMHEHRWLTPAAAIAARDAGGIALAPPTWVTIWQLLDQPTAASALAEAAGRPPRRFLTRIREQGGRTALVWEGDAAWGEGALDDDGPRRRLWVGEAGPWRAESPAGAP